MIFISYRRDDTAYFTGRLADRLMDRFGRNSVFQDVTSIPGGKDFVKTMEENISKARVGLVIIGPRWLESVGGKRRIDDDADYVRFEISRLIDDNKRVLVIPIYLDERYMLSKESKLPDCLTSLLTLNARVVRPGIEFDDDLRRILVEVEHWLFPGLARLLTSRLRRFVIRSWGWLLACLLVMLIVIAFRDTVGARVLITQDGLPSALRKFDMDVFSVKQQDQSVFVGRILPDRRSLSADTDLPKSIRDTKSTFDVHSVAATAFLNDDENLRILLDRGVRIRLLLVDHSESNRQELERYFANRAGKSFDLSESLNKLRLSIQRVERLNSSRGPEATGKIELRFWRGPYWNSFWIRDSGIEANAMGHIEIGFHGDADMNPSVRFGQLGAPLVMNLQEQFNLLWDMSALNAAPYLEDSK